MTLLGKILTVLILIMSVVFFTMSMMVFATHKNWKELALSTDSTKLGLKPKLDQYIERLDRANKEIQALKNSHAAEAAARRYALAALQSKATQFEEQLSLKQAELDVMHLMLGGDRRCQIALALAVISEHRVKGRVRLRHRLAPQQRLG